MRHTIAHKLRGVWVTSIHRTECYSPPVPVPEEELGPMQLSLHATASGEPIAAHAVFLTRYDHSLRLGDLATPESIDLSTDLC